MSETHVAVVSIAASKKAGKAKASGSPKKAKSKPTHPKTSDMVNAAIKSLKERGGSSLQAIKKYIGANYKVDAEKLAPFIRKYLKAAVTSGSLVQTKGKGASGSFKLPAVGEKAVVKKKSAKPSSSKSVDMKAKKLKSTTVKKPAVKKSASSTPKKSPKLKSKTPTPSKVKKVKKAPTKKPKAPKPKKVGAAKPKSTKKTAAKKK